MNRIHLCFVSFPLFPGGPQVWLRDVCRFINKKRFSISVLVVGETDLQQIIREDLDHLGINIIDVPASGGALSFIKRVLALYRILKSLSPVDILHSSIDLRDGEVMLASWLANIPVRISHARNAHFYLGRSEFVTFFVTHIKRFIVRRLSNTFFAISEASRDAMFATSKKWKQCGYIVPTAIDLDAYLNAGEHRSRKNCTEPITVGHIGRFALQKNHQFILEVFRELCDFRKARLILVGNGRLRSDIEGRVRNYGLEDSVEIIEPTSSVPEILKRMDVMLFPSKWEGFGRVALEAQAAGVPVVASTNVPEDIAVVPQLVRRLSLNMSAKEWAVIVSQAADYHVPHSEIRTHIELSSMYMPKAIKDLEQIYVGAMNNKKADGND
jgi:glycosyltransferase involved in cell wall biosynthesis